MTITLPHPDRFSVNGDGPVVEEHVPVLVIGGGAAGCAAAGAVREAGVAVMLIDEHPVDQGSIGLDVPYHFGGRASAAVTNPERLVETLLAHNEPLLAALEAGVDVRVSTVAWGAWVPSEGFAAIDRPLVGLADATRSWFVSCDRLILATGARDFNVSFEGSELPGVMGMQGFAALLNRYEAFTGKRIAILGSGPLAIATAELALAKGLDVVALVEAQDASVMPPPEGVTVMTGHVPLAVSGGINGVEQLMVARRDDLSATQTLACDTVCIALATVPMIELGDVLGLKRQLIPVRGGHVPIAGADGSTSAREVFVAGDCAGLCGDAAASGHAAAASALFSMGHRPNASAPQAVAEGFDTFAYQRAWVAALLETGGADVKACLCEEVTRGEVLGVAPPQYLNWHTRTNTHRDLRRLAEAGPLDQDQIKRLTRACMGVCQARRCREQVSHLMALGTEAPSESLPLAGYRAPVRPLPLSVLADQDDGSPWNVWFGISTQWIMYDDIGTEREQEQLAAGMPY